MRFAWTPLAVPSLAAALLTAAMAIHLWCHRSKTVGAPLLVAVLGASLWMFSEALGVLAADLATRSMKRLMLQAPILPTASKAMNTGS